MSVDFEPEQKRYLEGFTAGLMVGQFARWLRGLPVVPDQTLNLLAAELTVAEAHE